MKIEFISVSENDLPIFIETHHRSYRETIEKMFGWNDAYQKQAAIKEFQEREPKRIIIDSQFIGFLGCQDLEEYLWFGPFYILPEYQGKGFGSAVLQSFIDSSLKDIKLRTLTANDGAKSLYEKFGFELIEQTDIHFVMERKIKPL
jgi:ribosomal protein S18 acetylase RimI-like enzyme